jgi:ribosomal protein S18 acetylase RimI-like enzyme
VVTAHFLGNPVPVGFYAMTIRLETESDLGPESGFRFFSQAGLFSAVRLCSVAVQLELHRQGFGTVLMGAALRDFYEIVTRTGINAMTLEAANHGVIAFYEGLGFVRYGRSDTPMPKMILPAKSVVEMIEV